MDIKPKEASMIHRQIECAEEAIANLDAKICTLCDKIRSVLALDTEAVGNVKSGAEAPRTESEIYLKLETLTQRIAYLARTVGSVSERVEC